MMSSCRAAWSRHFLNGLKVLDAAQLQSLIDPEQLVLVSDSGALAWIPLEAHLAVLKAGYAMLGESRFREFCRERVRKSLVSPVFFAQTMRVATALFDYSPWAVLQAAPRSLPFILRGAGVLYVQAEQNVTVSYSQMPPWLAKEAAWLAIWEGTLIALGADLVGTAGQSVRLELTEYAPRTGTFCWRLTATDATNG